MQKAIIIGATSGIGQEVARILVQQGWHIGIAGRREEALHALQATAPDRIVTEQLDVTEETATLHLHNPVSYTHLRAHETPEHLDIHFTDIRPGFVATDLLKSGKYPMLMKADRVAQHIIKALREKRRVVVIDGRYRVLVFFWRMIPRWLWERLPITN